MNQNQNNPYAPPAVQPSLGSLPPLGGPQPSVPWTPTEVIGQAWKRFKQHAPVLIGSFFATFLFEQIPGYVANELPERNEGSEWTQALLSMADVAVLCALLLLIHAFIQGGLTAMSVKAARGETPTSTDAFSGGRWFLRMLGLYGLVGLVPFVFLFLIIPASFLVTPPFTGIILIVGFLLLIVPSIIVGLGLMLAPYYVVDQNMGSMDAMRASWRATKGQRMNLFVLGLLCSLIILLGGLACGFGLFVAWPIVSLAMAIAYLHISGRIATSSNIAPPFGGPPGGYPGYGGYGSPGGYPPPGGGYGPPGGGYPGGGYGSPGGGYAPPGGGYPPPGGGYGQR